MDQYQYPGAPSPSGGNPYEFILNPNQPQKAKKPGWSKNSFLRTIIFIVGGTAIFLIVLSIIINALAPKKISVQDFTGIIQTQTELMRISKQASSDSVQQVTKNLATTVEFTMATQQKQTIELLALRNNVKIGTKELALKQNATTDQKFAKAKSTSTYDKVYTEIIQAELTNYAHTLKILSTKGSSVNDRNRMSDYYQQTQLLISQIPYTQDNLGVSTTSTQ